ncbi:hypothetical protein MRX96_035252 [Rhipicephalus microplus]
MNAVLCLLLCWAPLRLQAVQPNGEVFVRNPKESNFYMDRILLTDMIAQVRFLDLDPFHLPPFETDFKDSILGIPVHGHAKFVNGTLRGLSRVNRFGDCTVPPAGLTATSRSHATCSLTTWTSYTTRASSTA